MSYPSDKRVYPPANESHGQYDESENTTSEMGERFEDEPGRYKANSGHNNNDQYMNDPYDNDGRTTTHDTGSPSYTQASIHPDDAYYQPDPYASAHSNPYDQQSVAGQSYRQPGEAEDERSRSVYSTPASNHHSQAYPPTRENMSDARSAAPDPYDRRGGPDQAPFEDHDPYSNQQRNEYSDDPNYDNRNGSHNNDDGRYDDDANRAEQEQEQAPPPAAQEPRKHKYSTANLKETGKWKKWCSICLIFLLFLAFMIALSMLFDYLFFGDVSDNGPKDMQREENGTFSKDKQEVDAACGRATFLQDEGALCEEACVPHYFDCCDPFDEFKLYNYTKAVPTKAPTPAGPNVTTVVPNMGGMNGTNITNATIAGDTLVRAPTRTPTKAPVDLSSNKFDLSDDKNTSFMDEYGGTNNMTCSFDQEVRGCMAYAKCQALTGQADPSSNNLPDLCSMEQLEKDPDACQEQCRKLDCCYSLGSDNCLAEKFDLCMDYAPCQNLKQLTAPVGDIILETAPRTLDYDCFWQMQGCFDSCEKASCCGDPESSCFRGNFMACLTYSPCTNVTLTSIVVPPQFSVVPKPPNEIVYACNAKKEPILQATEKTCEEYCSAASCCFVDGAGGQNCFHDDPLGCMAWDAQCQVLLQEGM